MAAGLDDFLRAHDWDLLRRVNGWDIERHRDLVFFSLVARDGERYRTRFECSGYPDEAPSVLFVNTEGSTLDPTAWPRGTANFHAVVKPPPHCFLCMPLTREGLQHHGEWRTTRAAWNPGRHTLMDLFNYLQRLLDSTDYQGRGP